MAKLPTSRQHQTAVFIRQGVNPERARRLVQSLNRAGSGSGSTIKADVFTVLKTGEILAGLQLEAQAVSAPVSDADLRDSARAAGYGMVNIVD